ncbi:MAG: hypothetical protein KGQ59_00010 [Bdellovibrionales bacterium]|nr:hypothetical protein [Bdellovibrionales bacterium]
MKSIVTVLSVVLGFNAFAGDPQRITLSDVSKKVSESNFSVYQTAIRVYQAKEAVKAARGNLLPHLNLWDIAGAAADIYTGGGTGGAGVVGLISDIVPFLIPANWFRVQEVKLLYQADQLGYQALWANELMSAKALYMHIVLDETLRQNVLENIEEVSKIHKIVQMRELLGGAPQGSAREIEIRLLALQEDKRSMEVLLQEEKAQLSFAMGMPAQTNLELSTVDLPDLATLEALNYDDFEYRAVDSSPEINQYDYFIAASDYVRRETMYSFLGASSMSRGAGGGVFDNIPVTPGLGFGTGPSMRIVSAQKDILKLQKEGAEEVIKRQLKLLVNNYNLDLENYRNLKKRTDLAKAALDQLFERLSLGENFDMLTLVEASRNHLSAAISFYSVQYRFLLNEDKLGRLIFHGDYSNLPNAQKQIEEGRKP